MDMHMHSYRCADGAPYPRTAYCTDDAMRFDLTAGHYFFFEIAACAWRLGGSRSWQGAEFKLDDQGRTWSRQIESWWWTTSAP